MKSTDNLNYAEATLVDVRTIEEFNSGTAPGALNIPLPSVADKIDEFKAMKKPIVVFCRSGARSGQAAAWLKQNGIEVNNGGGLNQVMEALQ